VQNLKAFEKYGGIGELVIQATNVCWNKIGWGHRI